MTKDKWFENTNNLPITSIVQLEGKYRTDSLICAIEEVLIKKDEKDSDINGSELIVLAVEAMEREVNNGGFIQFFKNSSWRFTPYLSEALCKIGATETNKLAKKAINALDIPSLTKSTNITEYYENIQKAIEDEDVAGKLDELDSDYYKLKEDIALLLFNFIKKNIHDFE